MKGYDSVWFIGDDFADQTLGPYYIDRSDGFKAYARDLFEVCAFTKEPDGKVRDTISRFRNGLVDGINQEFLLPKIVVIVPDDDIINYLNYAETGVSKSIGRVLDWIMREHNRIIQSYKELLPMKAKKSNYPQIVWIHAPTHDNFKNNIMRMKFNSAIDSTILFHENTWSLQLKKVWDPHSHSLFNKEGNKFTIEGIKAYWEAVDKTIRFLDTILLKRPVKPKTPKRQENKGESQEVDRDRARPSMSSNRTFNDNYHWQSPEYQNHRENARGDTYYHDRRSPRARSRSPTGRYHHSRSYSDNRSDRHRRNRTPNCRRY